MTSCAKLVMKPSNRRRATVAAALE